MEYAFPYPPSRRKDRGRGRVHDLFRNKNAEEGDSFDQRECSLAGFVTWVLSRRNPVLGTRLGMKVPIYEERPRKARENILLIAGQLTERGESERRVLRGGRN